MNQRNYLVFGATGGIGSALTASLLEEGHRVVAGVRNLESAQQMRRLEGATLREFDALDWESVEQLVKATIDAHGDIDGVAVCVGSIQLKPAHLTSEKEFEATVSLNLGSCFAVLRSVAKSMMRNGGSIVFVSSAAARHGFPNHEAIAAAKAGVIGLTLSAAASYASYGIRVNCVAPGLVKTRMAEGITGNAMALKASENMHALGRVGEATEVASAIEWLLDSSQSWVTGQTIGVDGGLATVFSKKR